tara:strand:+ start:41 stop:1162 length:1122 start_codon:yes stop_codon:yes gene_type:complete
MALTPQERMAYQQDIRSSLGFNEQFGDGRYGNFIGTLNDNQRAIAESLEQKASSGGYATNTASEAASTPTTVEAPQINYDTLAGKINIPEVDYNKIQGFMTPTQNAVGTAAGGQPSTLFKGQADLTAGQTNLAGGQADLTSGQADLTSGQADLTSGQAGLTKSLADVTTDVGGVQTDVSGLASSVGQANLAMGQAPTLFGGQQDLSTGQALISQDIGQSATGQAPATGLYAGQSGLMSGQQQLGTDLSGAITGVGGDLQDFQRAVESYQRGAQGQRGEIQTAGVRGRELIGRQLGDVGVQTNQIAEQQAQARQAPVSPMTPPPSQQQAAQFAQTAGQGLASSTTPQQLGPMGPVAQDPRDMFLNQQGIMNPLF